MRSQGEASGLSSSRRCGAHDICSVRAVRSGCGIMIGMRPSAVVKPVAPPGEPFGLAG
jgi:hypothetical protein